MTFDSVSGRADPAQQADGPEEGYGWGEVPSWCAADFTPFAQTAAGIKTAIVVGHYGAEREVSGSSGATRCRLYWSLRHRPAYGASRAPSRRQRKPAAATTSTWCCAMRCRPTTRRHGRSHRRREKYGVADPTSMHVTGWVLGMFAEEALKKCGATARGPSLDKAIQA